MKTTERRRPIRRWRISHMSPTTVEEETITGWRSICSTGGYQHSHDAERVNAENEANARLIVALPDLLEAVREGLICAESDVEGRENDAEPGDQILAVFRRRRDLIRAAIAKAEGQP